MEKLSQRDGVLLIMTTLGISSEQKLNTHPEMRLTPALKCGDAVSYYVKRQEVPEQLKKRDVSGDPFTAVIMGTRGVDTLSDEPMDLYDFTKMLNAAFHSLQHMIDWDCKRKFLDPDIESRRREYSEMTHNPLLRMAVGTRVLYEIGAEMRGVTVSYDLLTAWFGENTARELTVRYVNEKMDLNRTAVCSVRDKHYDDTDKDFIVHFALDLSNAMAFMIKHGVSLPKSISKTEKTDDVLKALLDEANRLRAVEGIEEQ